MKGMIDKQGFLIKCERCGRKFKVDEKWLKRYEAIKNKNPKIKVLCVACVFNWGQRYDHHYYNDEYIGKNRP